MFSKEESQRMRQEFWTSFGKSFPTKWTLYNTKIKGFSFKFYFDTKKAMVLVEIDGSLDHRVKYFEKMQFIRILSNLKTEKRFPVYLSKNKESAFTIGIHGRKQWNFSPKKCRNSKNFGRNIRIFSKRSRFMIYLILIFLKLI